MCTARYLVFDLNRLYGNRWMDFFHILQGFEASLYDLVQQFQVMPYSAHQLWTRLSHLFDLFVLYLLLFLPILNLPPSLKESFNSYPLISSLQAHLSVCVNCWTRHLEIMLFTELMTSVWGYSAIQHHIQLWAFI